VELTIAEEDRAEARQGEGTLEALLARLSRQSVTPGKHFDAYTDIDWEAPEHRLDPEDPRFELAADDHPLGRTAWYQAQPPAVRARIGLHLIANNMKTGLEFESVLKRGLLEYAATRVPNRSPEFRYVYHEIIEEAQHSLMFQEFVNRSGFDPPGIPRLLRPGTRQVIANGRRFPKLFFVFVLGGEDPIDHVQRTALRRGRPIHPLLERIMRIHVTEEARHLSFARQYLRTRVPRLGPVRRRLLAYQAPIILALMARLMMRPSTDVVRTYGIPRAVVREAYTRNPEHRAGTREALRKVRSLCTELGLVTGGARVLWRVLGIWDDVGGERARARGAA
jgi:P-aminobenzoate N-oxygenase AurF